jgi:hypothetical protein
MKKFFAMIAIAGVMVACNDAATGTDAKKDTPAVAPAPAPVVNADSAKAAQAKADSMMKATKDTMGAKKVEEKK